MIAWCMKHGKFVYPEPCEACARASRYVVDHGPKVTPEDRRLLMLYGITKAEKTKVLDFQGGGCAVCERPPVTVALGSDHNHTTAAFRGLLCLRCNKGLSLFADNPVFLERAAAYLKRYPSQIALGYTPIGRVGRSTRKWKTKTEKRERMAWVKERIKALWPRAL